MARVTGPLMSIDASGSVAGTVVFAKWRGRNYVRRHAVPANPKTTAQLAARAIVRFLATAWASIIDANKATWSAAAEAKKISSFNEFVAYNARNWRDNLAPSQDYPGARDGTADAPGVLVATVEGRQVQLSIPVTPGAQAWGIAICRSLTGSFTPSASNCIAIVPADGTTKLYTDGPLPPDTYYYNAIGFTVTGAFSAAGTEASAVVA